MAGPVKGLILSGDRYPKSLIALFSQQATYILQTIILFWVVINYLNTSSPYFLNRVSRV